MTCRLCQGREERIPERRMLFKSFMLSNEARQGLFEAPSLSWKCSLSVDNYVIRRFDVYCHFIYLPEVPVETSPLKTDPTWLFLCSPSNKNDSREISPNAMTTLSSGFTFLTSRSRLLRVTAWLSNARCSSWIFEVPAVLQMPPALPVPSFYDNIHPLSYAVRRSINHHMMAIIVCG